MCPVAWAGWSQFILQSVFAVAGTVAMVYLIVTTHRQNQDRRKSEAKWDATRAHMEQRLAGALSTLTGENRTDA